MTKPGHGYQCEWPDGFCSHPDHLSEMSPHARQLFVSANGSEPQTIWAGFRFWVALSELSPEAKTYDEAIEKLKSIPGRKIPIL